MSNFISMLLVYYVRKHINMVVWKNTITIVFSQMIIKAGDLACNLLCKSTTLLILMVVWKIPVPRTYSGACMWEISNYIKHMFSHNFIYALNILIYPKDWLMTLDCLRTPTLLLAPSVKRAVCLDVN